MPVTRRDKPNANKFRLDCGIHHESITWPTAGVLSGICINIWFVFKTNIDEFVFK